MQGKKQDIHLAESLRDKFISQYNDEDAFQRLLDELGDNCSDRLIHRLKKEVYIDLFRDYVELKKLADDIKMHSNREIFIEVCKVNEAREWINDNGKYTSLTFEALYRVFRNNEGLIPFIKIKK